PFAYRSGAKTARSSSERLHKQEKRRRLTIRQSEKQTNTLSLILNWRRGGRTKFVCILPILAIRLLAIICTVGLVKESTGKHCIVANSLCSARERKSASFLHQRFELIWQNCSLKFRYNV